MTTALLAAAVFVPTFAGLRGWRVRLPWRVTVRVVRRGVVTNEGEK